MDETRFLRHRQEKGITDGEERSEVYRDCGEN